MADDDIVRGEDVALKKAQWRKLSQSIRRDWQATSYNPRSHLTDVQHQGDAVLLQHMAQAERATTSSGRMPDGVAWYMAWRDMEELWDNYAAQSFRQRERARTAS